MFEVDGSVLLTALEGLELRRKEIRAYISEVQRLLETHGTGPTSARAALRREQENGRGAGGRRTIRAARRKSRAQARTGSKGPAPVIAFERPAASLPARASGPGRGNAESKGAVRRFPAGARQVTPRKASKPSALQPVKKTFVSKAGKKLDIPSTARAARETATAISADAGSE